MRKRIVNRTYHNFMIVYNALQMEKGYTPTEAEKITRELFDTLENNPGCSIWTFYNFVISSKENEKRQQAEKIEALYKTGLASLNECLVLAMEYGEKIAE